MAQPSLLEDEDDRFSQAAIIALYESGDRSEAEWRCRERLRRYPACAFSWNILGCCATGEGSHEEAIAAFRRAIASQEDFATAWYNCGKALSETRRFSQAFAHYHKAETLEPGIAEKDAAMLHLQLGHYAAGWAGYERRPIRTPVLAGRPAPRWTGEEPLAGRTIFVHSEQGMGDTLQFVRYVDLLEQRGGRVILSVQTPLVPLLSRSFPQATVLGSEEIPEHFDYHSPLLSLPFAFETTEATIPFEGPYLRIDPARISRWQGLLDPGRFNIGICWQGAVCGADVGRSFPLAQFGVIAGIGNVNLISLHKGSGEEQLASFARAFPVTVPGPGFDPEGEAFLDTATIMSGCALVITSDTSIAHLAGGLGVPTWLVLRRIPDWRWLLDRDDCPWYPSLRLFRQEKSGDWTVPFARMALLLAGRLAGGLIGGAGGVAAHDREIPERKLL